VESFAINFKQARSRVTLNVQEIPNDNEERLSQNKKETKTKESTFFPFIIMHSQTWYWFTFFCTLFFYSARFDTCSNVPFTISWVQ
jgi:hypothetical protein